MVNGHSLNVFENTHPIILRGRWFADIETDGLLDQLTKIHCIVLRHMDTDEVQTYGPDEIKAGLFTLMHAEEVCGHNWIAFDGPALEKVYPTFTVQGKVTDTLVLSRLIKTMIYEDDIKRDQLFPYVKPEAIYSDEEFEEDRKNRLAVMPKKLFGSHGLKAWGYRLSENKGDYDGGWETFSESMLTYCIQDTLVTKALYQHLMAQNFPEESLDLEHSLAHICLRIGNNGWTFDQEKATALYAELCQKRNDLLVGLDKLFPPWEVSEEFIPKSNNASRGYVKGEVFIKTKIVEFNPGSRRHIEKCLRDKYNWKPSKFTATGHAQIDETTLGELNYEEAKHLAEYFLIQKRLGQLAEGPAAWLKKVDKDGKIRHTIVSGGTVSGRAAHRNPNLATVPKTSLPYGQQCRELFTVPTGWSLVGVDLQGLELRALASFLDDGGEYTKQILSGDIHQYTADQIGVQRSVAKTFIYALCFGAGDTKIGSIVGGKAKDGKALKASFYKNMPAFAKLQNNLKQASKRGHLVGLDGRKLYIRGGEERRLLSQLLQSSGAIICKKWLQLVDQQINEQFGPEKAYCVGWVHDELQLACENKEIADEVLKIAIKMARYTGEYFKTACPMDADGKVARTWADTH